jgi:hypothetical protein
MKIHVLHAHDCVGVARDRARYVGKGKRTWGAHGAMGVLGVDLMAGMALHYTYIKHYSSRIVLAWPPPFMHMPHFTSHIGTHGALGCRTVRDRRRGPSLGWQASIWGPLGLRYRPKLTPNSLV